jgi:pimeloyl-ACP methyl ester carboxylesterase
MIVRFFRLAALAALATVMAAGAAQAAPKAHVVLVHGAWMGAAAWDKVAADLRGRGFVVTAVELPGHGKDSTPAEKLSLAGYVDAVVAALPAQGRTVLVGHSMAGMVISGVAEKVPARLSRLVYVAAYLPANGQSLYQLSSTDADSRVGKYWSQDNPQQYTPASIRKEGIVEVFGADTSPADQAFLLATHKPEAIAPLGTPVQLTAANFGSVPRVYVHTTQDRAVSYTLQKTMLAKAGGAAKVVELESSHVPMLSQPKALADAIADAAN